MLKSVAISGFKSFGKKVELSFGASIASVVGPNGSGKSNVAEALRFVLGEQSMKSMRSKKGEDLIWGGSGALPRGNRASVQVVFDNRSRRLDLDFDEVVLERVVYRDGQNEYLINGTQVRLKDVIRLLASANIGGSGYQIISQGEADRVLSASPRERREMVEDALGLKLYQHKKAESERKLEETRLNMEKVESLRRELAPHLKFLRKQVEKIEKTKELKDELAFRLGEYLAREHAWLQAEKAKIDDEQQALSAQRATIASAQEQAVHAMHADEKESDNGAVLQAEQALYAVRERREEVMRTLGRAEGALEAMKRVSGPTSMPTERATAFARVVLRFAEVALTTDDVAQVREQIARIRDEASTFVHTIEGDRAGDQEKSKAEFEVAELARQLAAVREEELVAQTALNTARAAREKLKEAAHQAERQALQANASLRELEGRMRDADRRAEEVVRAREAFEGEIREGIALIGAAVHGWEDGVVPEGALAEHRGVQLERRRSLERLKIKIEEYGAGNSDEVLREFKHTHERDEFLGRELADLTQSQQSLLQIIEELDAEMDRRFTDGLTKINDALHVFFTRLFGGGEAKLFIEKPRAARAEEDDEVVDDTADSVAEDASPVAGLSIAVQLPRKKVRGLEVLSGGERALTSIALIFAMSQVNPPPFLILDETDAALDEANSKRYADMLTALSERSQLIVITHNRATMAAAGELYGVTMGQDGVSRLLSVRLEEAERVAK